MRDYFWLTAACWAVISAWHWWRYWRRRHMGSLVPAIAPWFAVAYSGREGHWIPLSVAHVPTTAALVIGVFGACLYSLMAWAELRRAWPEMRRRLLKWWTRG